MASRLTQRLHMLLGATTSVLLLSANLWPATSPTPAAKTLAPKPAADLAAIRKRPVFFRGETVQLTIQIGAQNDTWNPYLTRFDTKRYQSWSAWADSQALWHYPDYMDSAPRLFARRGSKAAIQLSDAKPFERFLVTATVRTVFMGEPWIELHIATPLAKSLGKGSLLHASRAMDFAADELFQAATDQFQRALDAPMPFAMEQRMRAELEAAEARIDEPVKPVEEIEREG